MGAPLGPTGLHRASAHGAGKGKTNKRGHLHHNGWPLEQEEWLRANVAASASYGQLRDGFTAAFPQSLKTRNAILGKCNRLDILTRKKPGGRPGQGGRGNKRVAGADKRIKLGKQAPTLPASRTAVSGDASMVRDDGDPAIQGRGHGRKLSTANPADVLELAKRAEGYIPDISGEQTYLSKPIIECTRFECKWPISDKLACGRKAVVGAYCGAHARLAFRVMPTAKRNARGYGR